MHRGDNQDFFFFFFYGVQDKLGNLLNCLLGNCDVKGKQVILGSLRDADGWGFYNLGFSDQVLVSFIFLSTQEKAH